MNKELLLSLGDRVVKIDRGGPESRVGKILAVEDDHLTVLTENDGVVYYNTHHVKSLTDNAKEEMDFELEVPEDFEFIRSKDFKGVLENLRFTWVQINRGGPEMLEGVLYEINDDFVAIVAHEEVIRLSMFHIRNISYGNKVEKVNQKEEEVKSSSKNSKQDKKNDSAKENEA
ncbi:hypothetical protein [Virgibacillus halodenitrificans]|uniref:hypothetical protein n=1 Tax=Virgibacillus halodenitrificans TaxID=1482 RepID=UPI002DBB4F48|nr:hypothetical protein [Virgibacillus halodenitrificans]MEC2159385.1 hypothetical protein [Virgibacillus halodenitrificans]